MVTRSPYDVFTASDSEPLSDPVRFTLAELNQLRRAMDNVTEPADGWSAHDQLRIKLSDLAIWLSIG